MKGLVKELHVRWASELGRGPTGRERGGEHPSTGADVPDGTSSPASANDRSGVRSLQDGGGVGVGVMGVGGGLTLIVAVELVLRTVLGLLNYQFPRLNIDFELQLLRNPQGFCLYL